MHFLILARCTIFGLVITFSLVELALCAKDMHVTKGGVFIDEGPEILMLSPFFFPFAAFGLATSVLTLLFLVPISIIDVVRDKAITSVLAFELIWTGILWILWLAVAADATAAGIFDNCSYEDARINTICHQFPALQGLAFFNWLLLFGWFITLGILAVNLRRTSNRTSLWRQSVVNHKNCSSLPVDYDISPFNLKLWKRSKERRSAHVGNRDEQRSEAGMDAQSTQQATSLERRQGGKEFEEGNQGILAV